MIKVYLIKIEQTLKYHFTIGTIIVRLIIYETSPNLLVSLPTIGA